MDKECPALILLFFRTFVLIFFSKLSHCHPTSRHPFHLLFLPFILPPCSFLSSPTFFTLSHYSFPSLLSLLPFLLATSFLFFLFYSFSLPLHSLFPRLPFLPAPPFLFFLLLYYPFSLLLPSSSSSFPLATCHFLFLLPLLPLFSAPYPPLLPLLPFLPARSLLFSLFYPSYLPLPFPSSFFTLPACHVLSLLPRLPFLPAPPFLFFLLLYYPFSLLLPSLSSSFTLVLCSLPSSPTSFTLFTCSFPPLLPLLPILPATSFPFFLFNCPPCHFLSLFPYVPFLPAPPFLFFLLLYYPFSRLLPFSSSFLFFLDATSFPSSSLPFVPATSFSFYSSSLLVRSSSSSLILPPCSFPPSFNKKTVAAYIYSICTARYVI